MITIVHRRNGQTFLCFDDLDAAKLVEACLKSTYSVLRVGLSIYIDGELP